MGLTAEYDEDFEKCWKVYPKWPTGRSKKQPSYVTFQKVRKQLKFTPDDVAAIVANIEARVLNCQTWQAGDKFGPPMFSTFFNQHLWNEPYEKKGRDHWSLRIPDEPSQPRRELTEAEIERGKATLSKLRQTLH